MDWLPDVPVVVRTGLSVEEVRECINALPPWSIVQRGHRMQGTLEGDRVVMQMMFVSDPRSRALYARLTHDPATGHAVLEGVLRPPRKRLILPFFGAFAVGLTTVAVAGLVSTAGHTLFFIGLIAFGWFAFLTMLFPRLWFPNPARAQRAMVEWLERNFEATVELGGGQHGLRH